MNNSPQSGAALPPWAPRVNKEPDPMQTNLQHQTDVIVGRRGVLRRRDFLRVVSAAGAAAGALRWPDLMALQADELKKRGMACILLWMQGGPSQFETFSPKPGHENGGQ